MNIDDIKEIIRAMDDSSIGSLDYSEGAVSLSLRKCGENVSLQSVQTQAASMALQSQVQRDAIAPVGAASAGAASETGAAESAAMQESEPDKVITSPLVGTFYAAASPEDEPYVKVGDTIKKGQVLGIIEAMKLMNEVEADFGGKVEAILVENGQMVEYGQPLFRIS